MLRIITNEELAERCDLDESREVLCSFDLAPYQMLRDYDLWGIELHNPEPAALTNRHIYRLMRYGEEIVLELPDKFVDCMPKYAVGDYVVTNHNGMLDTVVIDKVVPTIKPFITPVMYIIQYNGFNNTITEDEIQGMAYIDKIESQHIDDLKEITKQANKQADKKESKEKMKEYKIGKSVYTKLVFGGNKPEQFSDLIKSVHFNDEKFTTTVVLVDGRVGMSTCMGSDVCSYDRYSGFAIALMNALFGSKTSARKFIQESIDKQDKIDCAKKKAKVNKSYKRREEEMEHDDNFTSDYPHVDN